MVLTKWEKVLIQIWAINESEVRHFVCVNNPIRAFTINDLTCSPGNQRGTDNFSKGCYVNISTRLAPAVIQTDRFWIDRYDWCYISWHGFSIVLIYFDNIPQNICGSDVLLDRNVYSLWTCRRCSRWSCGQDKCCKNRDQHISYRKGSYLVEFCEAS